jgi:hypothetical protein
MYVSSRAPLAAPNDLGVDVLLDQILALPPVRLDALCNRMVGRPQLAAAGWILTEKREAERPNEKRDREWIALNDGGLSYADIAHAHGDLPRSTVASACQRYRQFVRMQILLTERSD